MLRYCCALNGHCCITSLVMLRMLMQSMRSTSWLMPMRIMLVALARARAPMLLMALAIRHACASESQVYHWMSVRHPSIEKSLRVEEWPYAQHFVTLVGQCVAWMAVVAFQPALNVGADAWSGRRTVSDSLFPERLQRETSTRYLH